MTPCTTNEEGRGEKGTRDTEGKGRDTGSKGCNSGRGVGDGAAGVFPAAPLLSMVHSSVSFQDSVLIVYYDRRLWMRKLNLNNNGNARSPKTR